MPSPAQAPAKAAANAGSALNDAFHLHQLGNLDEAEAMYRSILRANPRNGDAWHLLGVARLQRQDMAEAERAIGIGIVEAPGYFANLGVVLRGLGHSAEAVESYRKALRLTPEAPRPPRQPGHRAPRLKRIAIRFGPRPRPQPLAGTSFPLAAGGCQRHPLRAARAAEARLANKVI